MNIVTRNVFYGLLFIAVFAQTSSGQNSPCENIFKYRFTGSEWFGVIFVENIPRAMKIDAIVGLTLGRPLPDEYVGKLELTRSVQDSVNILRRENQITYRVLFPMQDPLPQLSYITINGRTICDGNLGRSPFTLTVKLNHQLQLDEPLPLRNREQNEDYEDYDYPYRQNNNNNNRPIVTEPPVAAKLTTVTTPPSSTSPPPVQPPPIINKSTVTNIDPAVRSGSEHINRFLENCGRPNNQVPLVHGGREPARYQYLWIIPIYTSRSGTLNFICGGSLITDKHVLTAAHCIRKDRQTSPTAADEIVVMAGKFDISDWGQIGVFSTKVDHYYMHPEFLSHPTKYNHDIAILVFRKVINFLDFDNIKPVCLWTMPNDLASIVGDNGTIVGWGRDENGRQTTPTPRELNVPIVSQENCFLTDLREFSTNTTLCAGNRDGRGPCTGDSGGGLFMWVGGRYYLRGIISIALQDDETRSCNLREFSVYTDVAKYIKWIEEMVESD